MGKFLKQIRFMGWNEKERCLGHVITLDWNKNQIEIMDSIGNCDWYSADDIELLEYTGCNDDTKWEDLSKSEQSTWRMLGETSESWLGYPIFEGDIVDDSTVNKKWAVTWNPEAGGWTDKDTTPFNYGLYKSLEKSLKIVGKIYNPKSEEEDE